MQEHRRTEARLRLSPRPDPIEALSAGNQEQFTEDEYGPNRWGKALTRLDADRVMIVPIHDMSATEGAGAGYALFQDGREPLDYKRRLLDRMQMRVLQRSLPISHPHLVPYLRTLAETEGVVPAWWGRSPFLRYTLPLVFTNGQVLVGDRLLVLDPRLGLRTFKVPRQ
jgi:hypothetical protein